MPTIKHMGRCGCHCDNKYFDLLTVFVAQPIPVLSWGFDTSQPPGLIEHVEPAPIGNYKSWNVPLRCADFNDAKFFRRNDHFYTRMVTVDYYPLGCTITSVQEFYPFYFNPCDSAQRALYGDVTDETDITQDFRLTGFPTVTDSASQTTTTGDLTGGGLYSYPNTAQAAQMLDQSDCPPPDVTETSITQYFSNADGEVPPSGEGITPQPLKLMTRVITLSGLTSAADLDNKAKAMLAMVPLSPGTLVSTREGALYFDYLRASAVTGSGVPAATYSGSDLGDGTGLGYATFSVAPNQMYALQFGANEDPLRNSHQFPTGVGGPDYVAGAVFPYHWQDADYPTTGFPLLRSQLRPPEYLDRGDGTGLIAYTGGIVAGLQDNTNFCSRTGTITLRGTYNTPVTAKLSYSKTNRLVIFPLRGGALITAEWYDGIKLFPAVNAYNGVSEVLGGNFGQSLLLEKTLVRVPANPLALTEDPNLVSDFTSGTSFPTVTIALNQEQDDAFLLGAVSSLFQTLDPGEHIFGPMDCAVPSGSAWLTFSAPVFDAWNPPPNLGAGDPAGAGA